jgi:lysophospholipase L1-like esterase
MRTPSAVVIASLALASLSAQQPAAPSVAPQPATGQPAAIAPPGCPELATALNALMQNDIRRRDWPALGRYRDDNRTVARPSGSDARVVFMGDSITDSWPRTRAAFFAGKPYIGRGISGQTTPQMLVRFRPDVIDLNPKAVVILAGTNDIAGNTGPMTNEEIQSNLMSMAELAKAHRIKVIFSSILPTGAYHVGPSGVPQTVLRPMERIRVLNDWMKKYASAERHIYLDYFSAMLDDKGFMRTELTGDDLHPNGQGYAIMEPLVEAAIKQALR